MIDPVRDRLPQAYVGARPYTDLVADLLQYIGFGPASHLEIDIDFGRFDTLHMLIEFGAAVRRAVERTSGAVSRIFSSAVPSWSDSARLVPGIVTALTVRLLH